MEEEEEGTEEHEGQKMNRGEERREKVVDREE